MNIYLAACKSSEYLGSAVLLLHETPLCWENAAIATKGSRRRGGWQAGRESRLGFQANYKVLCSGSPCKWDMMLRKLQPKLLGRKWSKQRFCWCLAFLENNLQFSWRAITMALENWFLGHLAKQTKVAFMSQAVKPFTLGLVSDLYQ